MDILYLLVIAMFFAAIIAQAMVKSTYAKYSRKSGSRGITAEQAVQMVLAQYNIQDVHIQRIAGNLTDNFNPKTKIISLSESVYGSSSIAAIGVACHEAGHAVQHATGYIPIKMRNSVIPVCQIGSMFGIPIAILGLILNSLDLVYVGLFLYAFIAVFQFITLPVELDASRRALKVIDEVGILNDDERKGARKVLIAAAMTYVVALATALVNLLRFYVIFTGGRKRQ